MQPLLLVNYLLSETALYCIKVPGCLAEMEKNGEVNDIIVAYGIVIHATLGIKWFFSDLLKNNWNAQLFNSITMELPWNSTAVNRALVKLHLLPPFSLLPLSSLKLRSLESFDFLPLSMVTHASRFYFREFNVFTFRLLSKIRFEYWAIKPC